MFLIWSQIEMVLTLLAPQVVAILRFAIIYGTATWQHTFNKETVCLMHLVYTLSWNVLLFFFVFFRNCFNEPEDIYSVMKITWKYNGGLWESHKHTLSYNDTITIHTPLCTIMLSPVLRFYVTYTNYNNERSGEFLTYAVSSLPKFKKNRQKNAI